MNYEAAVQWLFGLTNYEKTQSVSDETEGGQEKSTTPIAPRRWDLGRVEDLVRRIGDPHIGPVTLHVAGTKGKGSTAALLAAALTSSGYKTGLFTSPHLHSIRERVAVDGYLISEEEFAQVAERLRPTVDEINDGSTVGRLTTFEVLTAMAFSTFKQHDVQMQVIEVGLGGRLDSTNVVQPTVTGITSISADHESFLGHSLNEIATEKAGIIKAGVPAVSAPQEPDALRAIEERCIEVGAPLTLLGRDIFWRRESSTRDGQNFRVWGEVAGRPIDHQLRTSLLGEHQIENAAIAMTMLELIRDLHYPVPHDTIYWGFTNVHWPGRLEILQNKPLIVADGAHNTYSAMRLAEAIREEFPGKPVQLVIGTSLDKDIQGMGGELAGIALGAIATTSRHERAMAADAVAGALWESGIPVRPEPTVAGAIEQALIEGGPDAMVLVTGSLFVVAEAREHVLGITSDLSSA